jgi:hypothetical protein
MFVSHRFIDEKRSPKEEKESQIMTSLRHGPRMCARYQLLGTLAAFDPEFGMISSDFLHQRLDEVEYVWI